MRNNTDSKEMHSGFCRYEYKYRLPLELEDEVRSAVQEWMEPDPHGRREADSCYTVRSIYFDTDDLRFYYEKIDSVGVRRKLRIRTYNHVADGCPAFLEIKRKIGSRGFKERLLLGHDQLEGALNGELPEEVLGDRPLWERRILERFRYNLKSILVAPVVLVTYEREAFVDPGNARSRVTLDRDIRSLWRPTLDQLFEERGLERLDDGYWILELKFDDHMPRRMASLVSRLNLRMEPYSKYCHGIYAWKPHDLNSLRVDRRQRAL